LLPREKEGGKLVFAASAKLIKKKKKKKKKKEEEKTISFFSVVSSLFASAYSKLRCSSGLSQP
jgi:hypothetical protein